VPRAAQGRGAERDHTAAGSTRSCCSRACAVRERADPHEYHVSFEELFAGDVDVIADRIAEQHLEKLFLTKNTEWESEREYRFVVRSPAEYEHVNVSQALVAVCRGPESAREAEHALRYFADEFGLAIGYVEWDHNDPRLLGRPLKR